MTTAIQEPVKSDDGAIESSDAAIVVRSLTHTYPAAKQSRRQRNAGPQDETSKPTTRVNALDDVSLTIQPGEIFGILGPNGSGKSTLFRILSTVLKPSGPVGSLTIMGHDVLAHEESVRGELGVVFQSPSLDVKLTARENLMHQGHLYGLKGTDLNNRINSLLDYFNLSDRASEYVERFSGGMRRRVELAKAMLHDPQLLLLDEPATGLDPGARHDLWQQLEQLRKEKGQTVALTTHLMEEADRCDRLAIISQGRVVAIDTPSRLKAQIGGDVLTLSPKGDLNDDALETLRATIETKFGPWDDGGKPICVAGRIRLEKDNGPELLVGLNEAFAGKFENMTVGQPTLEDVYLHLTGHTLWK